MKKLFYFLILVNIFWSQAQTPVKNFTVPTPNVSLLFQLQENSGSFYSGSPNITIPIFEFKENSITVPIYLSYNASGIRPDVHPGWVGQNWSLQAGGVITRIVKGLPDEYGYKDSIKYDKAFNHYSGYYYHKNRNGTTTWHTPENIRNQVQEESMVDNEPDEFLFNINGHGGRFYLAHDGKIYVQGSPDIKVEMNTFNASYRSFHETIDSNYEFHIWDYVMFPGFKITTPDGMKYEFGYYGIEETADYDFSVENELDFFDNVYTMTTTSAWYLRQIISLDKDTVRFYYTPGYTLAGRTEIPHATATFTRSLAFEKTDVHAGRKGLHPAGSHSSNTSSDRYNGKIQFTHYLKSIESRNKRIDFAISPTTELTYDYSAIHFDLISQSNDYQDNIFGGSPRNSIAYLNGFSDSFFQLLRPDENLDYNRFQWFKLDQIKVFDKLSSQYVQTWSFDYNNKSTERLMLLSLQKMGEPAFTFEYEDYYGPNKYENNYKLPPYNSYLLDHWGYFNNTNSTITNDSDNDLGDLYYSRREPRPEYLYTGQLNRIIYPTGSYVEYTYEPHTYTKKVTRNPNSGVFSLEGVPAAVAGGLRIKNIKYFDGNQTTMGKNYVYSDGILSKQFQYYWKGYKGKIQGSNNTYTSDRFISQNLLRLSGGNDSHVAYSKVIEVFPDNGKIEYRYSNYESNPDENFIATIDEEKSIFAPYSSKDFTRGNLLVKTYYDQQGNKTKQETYTYGKNVLPEMQAVRALYTKKTPMISGEAIEGASYYYYVYPYNMTSKTEIIFGLNQNDQFARKHTFNYNILNQLSEKIETQSSGEKIAEKYVYPSDILTGPDILEINKMKINHLFSPFIEKVSYVISDTTTRVIDGIYFKYQEQPAGIIKPVNVDILNTHPVSSLSDLYPDSDTSNNVLNINIHSSVRNSIQENFTVTQNDSQQTKILIHLELEQTEDPFPSTDFIVSINGPTTYYWNSTSQNRIIDGDHFQSTYDMAISLIPGNYTITFSFDASYNPITYFDGSCNLSIITEAKSSIAGNPKLNTEISYRYDSKGHVIEEKKHGKYTAYIWSHKYQNPLAHIENASFDEVKEALQMTDSQIQALDPRVDPENTDFTKLKDLQIQLPQALVKIYTYKPMVGVSSETNPSGQTIYYEYDSIGKLNMVKDSEKKILQHYQYHYQD